MVDEVTEPSILVSTWNGTVSVISLGEGKNFGKTDDPVSLVSGRTVEMMREEDVHGMHGEHNCQASGRRKPFESLTSW